MSRSRWISLARAGLVVGLVWTWAETAPPEAGEPWLLRWLRVWAWHPVRTGLALFLLDRALCRARATPPERTKPPATARGPGGQELG